MSSPEEPLTERTGADHARSGADVGEGVEAAERGSSVEQVHDGATTAERAAGDREMTGDEN